MSFLHKLFGNKQATDATKSDEAASIPESSEADSALQTRETEFLTLRDDGIRAMRMGEYAYAERCLLAALQRKDDDEIKSHLTETYILAQQGEKALPLLQELIQKHPDEIKLYLALCQLAEQTSDWEAMSTAAVEISRIDGNNPNGSYYLAKSHFERRESLEYSESLLINCIQSNPKSQKLLILHALILIELKRYDEALTDVQNILSFDPSDEEAYLVKAKLHEEQGDLSKALSCSQKLLELNPFNQAVALKTGKLLVQNHQLEEALTLYSDTLDLQPNFIEAYQARSEVRMLLHDEQGASDDKHKAEEMMTAQQDLNESSFDNIENKVEERYKALNPIGF